jgi:hypothetical protein
MSFHSTLTHANGPSVPESSDLQCSFLLLLHPLVVLSNQVRSYHEGRLLDRQDLAFRSSGASHLIILFDTCSFTSIVNRSFLCRTAVSSGFWSLGRRVEHHNLESLALEVGQATHGNKTHRYVIDSLSHCPFLGFQSTSVRGLLSSSSRASGYHMQHDEFRFLISLYS